MGTIDPSRRNRPLNTVQTSVETVQTSIETVQTSIEKVQTSIEKAHRSRPRTQSMQSARQSGCPDFSARQVSPEWHADVWSQTSTGPVNPEGQIPSAGMLEYPVGFLAYVNRRTDLRRLSRQIPQQSACGSRWRLKIAAQLELPQPNPSHLPPGQLQQRHLRHSHQPEFASGPA